MFLALTILNYLKDRSVLTKQVRIEKPGFCVKSGEDAKNIRKPGFWDCAREDLRTFTKETGFSLNFSTATKFPQKNPVSGHS
jgi:hypothetical protein